LLDRPWTTAPPPVPRTVPPAPGSVKAPAARRLAATAGGMQAGRLRWRGSVSPATLGTL